MKFFYKIVAVFFIVFYSCNNNENISEEFMISNIEEKIKIVASSRIFFGHQSVGQNIVDGLEKLNKDNDINILTKNKINELPESFFLNFKIGENEKPKSKCDEFVSIIDSIHNNIDFAFMKFCYIDINRNSNVDDLFYYYKTSMDSLIKKYPGVTFLHITSPLRFNAKGFGVWIRELLGRPNNSKLDNVKRNEYNDLLKSYYPEENIFDLAAAQSTYQNSKREYFIMAGKEYYSLIGDYTNDGGHLTELGSKVVAQDLVNFLAKVIKNNL